VVLGVKLVKFEVKEPVPIPFDVLVDEVIVGLVLVDQTTPLAVMDAPPSEIILPPEVALVVVMELADSVVKVGRTTGVLVVKVISFPYPVPALFVA
jgi:hypothetical protein